MNTFLYVLAGWIVVLYLVNKVREKRSKKNTTKILVKRNGTYQEVDAILLPKFRKHDVSACKDAGSDWFDNLNDPSEPEYYSGASPLKSTRDFAAKQNHYR